MATPIVKTSTETVIQFDLNNDKIYVQGTTLPANTTAGYAKGCIFVDTDVAGGTGAFYLNKGTNLSCTFTLVTQA